MGKKVPVTLFVDPEVGGEFTIKPFAAGLAVKPQATDASGKSVIPDGVSATATGTNLTGQADVDADVDYNG
jgi:hypothetical protein